MLLDVLQLDATLKCPELYSELSGRPAVIQFPALDQPNLSLGWDRWPVRQQSASATVFRSWSWSRFGAFVSRASVCVCECGASVSNNRSPDSE